MSWSEIKGRYKAIKAACDVRAPLAEPWSAFRDAVLASANDPPAHLRTALKVAAELEQERAPNEIVILDHGCGTGINLIYLAALGYSQVWGANVIPKAQ